MFEWAIVLLQRKNVFSTSEILTYADCKVGQIRQMGPQIQILAKG
jgi:hypothetical protein